MPFHNIAIEFYCLKWNFDVLSALFYFPALYLYEIFKVSVIITKRLLLYTHIFWWHFCMEKMQQCLNFNGISCWSWERKINGKKSPSHHCWVNVNHSTQPDIGHNRHSFDVFFFFCQKVDVLVFGITLKTRIKCAMVLNSISDCIRARLRCCLKLLSFHLSKWIFHRMKNCVASDSGKTQLGSATIFVFISLSQSTLKQWIQLSGK